ncbi:MAG: hypothetical protein GYA55_11690, partial [SAR324 cluster bacterium]|nr:hypothetical protein [SAR324 cluster bacterium]
MLFCDILYTIMRYIEIEPNPLINLPLAFGLLLSFIVHFAIFLSFSYTPKFQERTPFIANVSFEAPLREIKQSPLNESVAVPKDFATQVKRQTVSSPDNQNEASKSDIKPKHLL